MNRLGIGLSLLALSCTHHSLAQESTTRPKPSETAITIYNQDFAVIKHAIVLRLKAGETALTFDEATEQVEPQSVILRDPAERDSFKVLEQNYRFETASQQLLLSQFEGQTIEFRVQRENTSEIVLGKIIRSGFMDRASMVRRFGPQYYFNPTLMQLVDQPLIEVDGKLQFSLPGTPLFPSLPLETLLRPSLSWRLASPRAAEFPAELSYVTGGMVWQADYNVIAPKEGDALDVLAWVTIDNHTGKTFENATVKLMAGDINKLKPNTAGYAMASVNGGVVGRLDSFSALMGPSVSERAFDDYHLYSLARPVTLKNRETKQVELLRASGIPAKRVYVYDGFRLDPVMRQNGFEYLRQNRDFGSIAANTKVWIMEEFKNSRENKLGMPLPKGRMRFYRRDEGGQMEFIGENDIDHTPADEMVRVYTGSAFDITGERKRTNFRMDNSRESADESFEIKIRNHKKEAVQVRVMEHMYRGFTWNLTSNSIEFEKKDSQTIEFKIDIPPDGEQKVLYSVHYTW
jgi:hypothetical protein